MAILLVSGDKYCKLLSPLSYQVGILPSIEQQTVRENLVEELEKDATVLDISTIPTKTVHMLWNKFGNGMGSTDDAPAFVEALLLNGAREVYK